MLATMLGTATLMVLVAGLSAGVAHISVRRIEAKAVAKLMTARAPGRLWLRSGPGRHGSLVREEVRFVPGDQPGFTVGDRHLDGVDWAAEARYWDVEAARVRRSFLVRGRETAERWRNIFASALGLFAAILVLDRPALAAGSELDVLVVLVTFSLVLALNAVAFTGWAAAGMPKIQVDVDGPTLFVEQLRHGVRTFVRLRVGVVSGALSTVLLVLAVIGALRV
jgi:hypothetical protein